MNPVIRGIQKTQGVVGRDRELVASLAILDAGRHLLLEGPVGVGKTTVALAVCSHLGRHTVRVDGDDRYTESKLAGWFDPSLVLKSGYSEETFFPGPLAQCMRNGHALFINELNRMPESVQNVVLPALDEGLLVLPRIGEVTAAEGFQVIATQNPVEYIATGHLSEALRDRFEHVRLDYQSEEEEILIVRGKTGSADEALVVDAVRLTRETRTSSHFKKGASIRAAIAMVEIASRMGGRQSLQQAAMAALPTRVELKDEEEADLPSVLAELCESVKKNETSVPT